MIRVKRNGTDTVLTFDITTPFWDERVFSFKFACGSEEYAGLLAGRAQKLLEERMMEVRREAYEQGWKDAKARRAKRGFFGGLL